MNTIFDGMTTQPELIQPKPRTVYQVMWRLKRMGFCHPPREALNWTVLDNEVYNSTGYAEARLKHYQKSTLNRVLEFRVEAGQL